MYYDNLYYTNSKLTKFEKYKNELVNFNSPERNKLS